MSFRSHQSRLPSNFISIAVAAVVACGGYLLFSARYGAPMREAKAAAANYEQLQSRFPEAVEESVRQTVAELPDLESRVTAAVSQRVAGMDQIITSLNDRIRMLESEVAALKSRPVASFTQGDIPAIPAPTSPITPAPTSTTIPADTASQPVPPATTAMPQGILARASRGDLQVDLIGIRTSGDRMVADITVMRTRAGEGEFTVPPSGRNARVVTSSGVELSRLKVAAPGKGFQNNLSTTLIAQTPMRYQISFEGEVPAAPFVCRRIEFTFYGEEGSRAPLLLQFDNIAVTE